MTEAGIRAEQLAHMMKPFVAMVVAEVCPKKDDISQSKAYNEYTRRWIDQRTLSGDLTPRYVGSRKIYSRAQIEALRAVEGEPARIVHNTK